MIQKYTAVASTGKSRLALVTGLAMGLLGNAEAVKAEETSKWFLTNTTALRLNPIGLFNTSQVGYQIPLSQSDSPLFKGTYAKIAFAPSLSPAFGRWGVLAEVMPVSILRLSVLGEYVTYFGTFNFLQSFESPSDDFSDTAIKDLGASADATEQGYSATGKAVTFGALLQGKVGNIAARVAYRGIYQQMNVRDGDNVYYDPFLDILAPKSGWIHTADTDVLKLDEEWTYGLRHTFVATSYDGVVASPGAEADENTPTHRVGPLISKKLQTSEGSRISNPSAFLLVQWWLSHRYRTGAEVSQAMPLIAAGYTFNVDF